ncbi:hypothetical protein DESC_180066 [Desulfosarcina cetonica]|nr:hypothetical protein DESC_180066 [Desulfosarcina cetonica]
MGLRFLMSCLSINASDLNNGTTNHDSLKHQTRHFCSSNKKSHKNRGTSAQAFVAVDIVRVADL